VGVELFLNRSITWASKHKVAYYLLRACHTPAFAYLGPSQERDSLRPVHIWRISFIQAHGLACSSTARSDSNPPNSSTIRSCSSRRPRRTIIHQACWCCYPSPGTYSIYIVFGRSEFRLNVLFAMHSWFNTSMNSSSGRRMLKRCYLLRSYTIRVNPSRPVLMEWNDSVFNHYNRVRANLSTLESEQDDMDRHDGPVDDGTFPR
jgi:hypothetical protein